MTALTAFIVLIERQRWRQTGQRLVSALLALAMALGVPVASAAPGQGLGHGQGEGQGKRHKVARDLQGTLDAGQTRQARWSRDVKGRRMVQVVFVSNDADENMANLRDHIQKAGGSINAIMPGLRMLTAVLPSNKVAAVAERSDVHFVAPNRATHRTASTLVLLC